MKSLSQAEAGNVYTIKWLLGVPEAILNFLLGYNIQEGSLIRVVTSDPGYVIVASENHRLCIEKRVADHIKI